MSNENDLFFELQKSVAQFAYFQLGIAASAIAFAMHQTVDRSLDSVPLPIGLAVVLWAVSFAAGCAGIDKRNRGLHANTGYLFALREVPTEFRNLPDFVPTIHEAKSEVEDAVSKAGPRFWLQRWTIFLGGIAYIFGHVMDMAAR